MGVVDIDVDKVADMVVKIPNEDFTDVIQIVMWVVDIEVDKVVDEVLVHYCTLSLFDIWVTRQIIITNSQW